MAATLESAYKAYNKMYFGGRLPNIEVRWSKHLPRSCYGDFTWLPPLRIGGKVYRFGLVQLALWTKQHEEIWRMNLLHEMVHVKLRRRSLNSLPDYHSERWYKEMRRLAERGAFDKLW